MLFFGVILFGVVVWAGMLWLSIRIIDSSNERNRFLMALIWSAVNLAVSVAIQYMALAGLALAITYLVLMVKTLSRYYELGFFQTVGVIGLMIAAPYLLTPPLIDFVGDSELRGILALFGLPVGILGVWIFGRHRAHVRQSKEGLPEARVVIRARAETGTDARDPAAREAPMEQMIRALPDPVRAAPAPVPAVRPSQPPVRPSQPPPPIPRAAPLAPPPPAPMATSSSEEAPSTDGPRFLR